MSRREVAAGALLALGAAALSAFTILRGYAPHDEGLMLAWARRIADGQWPYRDFWSNYAPGQPLLLAALVKVFGPSLLWWRSSSACMPACGVFSNGNRRSPISTLRSRAFPIHPTLGHNIRTTATAPRRSKSVPT